MATGLHSLTRTNPRAGFISLGDEIKYNLIKLTESLISGFCCTALEPLIKLQSKCQHDAGLIEHEKSHARQ